MVAYSRRYLHTKSVNYFLYIMKDANGPEHRLQAAFAGQDHAASPVAHDDRLPPLRSAAPRNPRYNGGRWFTHTVEWTAEGFMAHGIVPVLMSYGDIQLHENLGHLVITPHTHTCIETQTQRPRQPHRTLHW